MIARPRVLPNPLDLVEMVIRWPLLAVADRARDAGPCPVQELPSSRTGSPKNSPPFGPTHGRVPQPGRARNRQGDPQAGSCQTAKDDGGKPGVRFLARSKRGTRFRTASPLGGTRQRRRRFCSPWVGREQGRRHCRWRSPDDRNWLSFHDGYQLIPIADSEPISIMKPEPRGGWKGSGSRAVLPHRSARGGISRSDVGRGMWRGGMSPFASGARTRAGEGCRRGLGHRRVARCRLRCWPRQDDQRAQSKLVGKPLAALDQDLGP